MTPVLANVQEAPQEIITGTYDMQSGRSAAAHLPVAAMSSSRAASPVHAKPKLLMSNLPQRTYYKRSLET